MTTDHEHGHEHEHEHEMPEWADRLFDHISAAIEFKGLAEMEGYYAPPEENDFGKDLFELAPAPMEVVEGGPNDGEEVYGVIHNLDLLAVQDAFQKVESLSFGFEEDGSPIFTLEGQYDGREVMVVINALPFPDEDDGELDDEDDLVA